MATLLKLILLTLLACNVRADPNDVPMATTKQGKMVGAYQQSTQGRRFSAFTGIPFAKPPIGELRFQAPVPAEPWKGILDASRLHPLCPQINAMIADFEVRGEEDCLFLNVYTPKVDTTKRPVVFVIHCGGWLWGHANAAFHGPGHLMDKDIVMVTINYRLGSLGFLSTDDGVVPGNNGLKDQNLALRWVWENIEHFGGDPFRITASGQSAGAASAHYHMLSPLSRDFVNGIIANSGSAFASWALSSNSENQNNSKKLAKYHNCPTTPSSEMIKCLQKVDVNSIVSHEKTLYEWSYLPVIPFKPVIEPDSEGAFITQDAKTIVESGKAANVPLLIGLTKDDGLMLSAAVFRDRTVADALNYKFDSLAPLIGGYDRTSADSKESTKRIKEFYFDNTTDIKISSLTKFTTDRWFTEPLHNALITHRKSSNAPLYNYVFDYRGSRSFTELLGADADLGVCHCDDLFYLYTSEIMSDYEPDQSDKDMTTAMVNMWSNFVITGNPTPAGDQSSPIKWEPVTTNNLQYLSIKGASNMEMKQDLYLERVNFLKSLPINTAKDEYIKEEL